MVHVRNKRRKLKFIREVKKKCQNENKKMRNKLISRKNSIFLSHIYIVKKLIFVVVCKRSFHFYYALRINTVLFSKGDGLEM